MPSSLPPNPPLQFDAELTGLLQEATLALGRLDGITLLLPEPGLFLYSYVRKEAVLSSQIEGTQSSLSDLLLYGLALRAVSFGSLFGRVRSPLRLLKWRHAQPVPRA